MNEPINKVIVTSPLIELVSITKDSEKIIEFAGRISHQSEKNRSTGSEGKFIRKMIDLGHLSVLEHASATFRIRGVSRAFSHQLVRHRLCSYTQKSQRYVSEHNARFIKPDSIHSNEIASKLYDDCLDDALEYYRKLVALGIPEEDARFVLPNATETEIIMTANFREWRHILILRGQPSSQWEIRSVAIEILRVLKSEAPSVFEDLVINETEKSIKVVTS